MTIFLFVIVNSCLASPQSTGNSATYLKAHSFTQDMDLNTFVSRWHCEGTAMPLHNHIMLTPTVPDRFGFQFHKYPLLTNDFKVDWVISAKRKGSTGSSTIADYKMNQGFAFWYVNSNVTDDLVNQVHNDVLLSKTSSDVSLRLSSIGWSLYGHKSKYVGFGVIFAYIESGGTGRFRPSVSLALNDGSKSINFIRDIPTELGSYWDFREKKLQIAVEVSKNGRNIRVVATNTESPKREETKLIDHTIPDNLPSISPGGYLGFTGSVSAKPYSAKYAATPADYAAAIDEVSIYDLHVYNNDPNQKGEDIEAMKRDQLSQYNSKDRMKSKYDNEDILSEHSVTGSARIESRYVRELSHNLASLLSSTLPSLNKVRNQLKLISSRVDVLENSVKTIRNTARSGGSSVSLGEAYDNLHRELLDVTDRANAHHQRNENSFAKLTQKVRYGSTGNGRGSSSNSIFHSINSLETRAADMTRVISTSRFSMGVLSLFICGLLLLLGFALYSRLRSWEKKHIL